MSQEKLNLTWHTYTDHLREMLHKMLSTNELTDVTLVSEDNIHFKAHKVVLSACSPVFKSIVSNNLLSHQIIFLRGIQSFEVESMLQFIYLGKALVYQDKMNEFLNAAKILEIKEVSNANKEKDEIKTEKQNIEETYELPTANADPLELEENAIINQKPIKSNPKSLRPLNTAYKCTQCERHFSDRGSIRRHVKIVHEGIRYPCDRCDYKATQQNHLQTHIKSVHDGVKYPCNTPLCNYMATQPGQLKLHIKSVHVKVTNPSCNQCNYKASKSSELKQHIKIVHGGSNSL